MNSVGKWLSKLWYINLNENLFFHYNYEQCIEKQENDSDVISNEKIQN